MTDPFVIITLKKIKRAVELKEHGRGSLPPDYASAMTFFEDRPAIEQIHLSWDEFRRLGALLDTLPQ